VVVVVIAVVAVVVGRAARCGGYWAWRWWRCLCGLIVAVVVGLKTLEQSTPLQVSVGSLSVSVCLSLCVCVCVCGVPLSGSLALCLSGSVVARSPLSEPALRGFPAHRVSA
jgi:hypothetical protein